MSIRHAGEPEGNAIRERLEAVSSPGQRTYTPSQAAIARAQGCSLSTVDGRCLVDFSSGVLVTNLGHGHPLFEERFAAYCNGLPRNAYNMVTAVEVEASERLVKSVGHAKADKVLWAASGSEGIQKAMWAALQRYPDRPIIVATRHGFHGKKGLAADVTGATSPNPNVRFISFPMREEKPRSFYEAELEALANAFPQKIALLITEPYLGTAGSFHPPKWYHQMLQAWCEAHDVVFIFDEVQSCFGRTGNMYAFQTYGVVPDLLVLGKGLANGESAAAAVGRADLIDIFNYGEISDTFSGIPRTCAAVCATLDVFEEESVVDNCRAMAQVMRDGLDGLRNRFDFITEVRGEGLVYGVEMINSEVAGRCVLEAYRGIGDTGVHFMGPLADKVLRVAPPLVIRREELAEAFAILETAWARVPLPEQTALAGPAHR